MKKVWTVVFLALVAMAVAVGVSGGEKAEAPVADFEIVIEPDATGGKLVCQRGCSWTELSFACAGDGPCRATVNQDGVQTN